MNTRPFRCVVYSLALLGLLVAVGPAVVQAADEPTVVAPGDPPLTREGIQRFTNLMEWLLDVPLTELQKQRIDESLRQSWADGDKEDIQSYVAVLALEAQTAALSPEERRLLREQAQPDVLKELRAQTDDEGARWLLEIYDAGHQPIAEGKPPLTRQVTDAFVELFCFMLSEAAGMKLEAPADLRDEMAKSLAASYPDLTPEEQA